MGKVTPKKRRLYLRKKRKAVRPAKRIEKKLSAENARINKLASELSEKFRELLWERKAPPAPEEVIEINRKITKLEMLLQHVQLEVKSKEGKLGKERSQWLRHNTKDAVSSLVFTHSAFMERFRRTDVKQLGIETPRRPRFRR